MPSCAAMEKSRYQYDVLRCKPGGIIAYPCGLFVVFLYVLFSLFILGKVMLIHTICFFNTDYGHCSTTQSRSYADLTLDFTLLSTNIIVAND